MVNVYLLLLQNVLNFIKDVYVCVCWLSIDQFVPHDLNLKAHGFGKRSGLVEERTLFDWGLKRSDII